MAQIHELRAVNMTSETRVTSLQKEVEDSTGELSAAAARIDQLVGNHVLGENVFLLLLVPA